VSRRRARGTALAACAVALTLAACGGGGEEAPQPEPAAAAPDEAAAGDRPARRAGGRRAGGEAPVGPAELPAHYQGLVRSEMASLEPAMQQLLSFIARGNGGAGATVARQIEQTFVLERATSQQERRRLHAELPRDFIERDHAFHRRAGALAQALEQGDFATASKTYAAMTRACVSCHTLYAAHRFPTLAGAAADGDEAEER
jgi:cytochrome c556